MKVTHIIPSALDYFEDIKTKAFEVMGAQGNFGVDCEAITLQYGSLSKSEKESIGKISGRSYLGQKGINSALDSLSGSDIVHAHCPLLGSVSKICAWKLANKKIPLIATYYRDVKISDLMSVFIWGYNKIFLPRLFSLAEAVAREDGRDFKKNGYANLQNSVFLEDIDLERAEEYSETEAVAAKYIMLYTNLS